MASIIETNKTAPKPIKQTGVSLQSGGDGNPNPLRDGGMGQAERAFSAASTFLSGIMAISASQLIGAPLKLIDLKSYESYMAWTKECFAILITTITQWWAPTVVRVSGDESMKGQLFLMDDGTLRCNFPHRLILMGNHQLYTDWLYLWWIAYTNKMHGRIYIVLKESLKRVPIIGWGMQFYNFIFLTRKWEQDQYSFKKHLDYLKNPDDPMWLLIFPEGTNLSAATREKSANWARKVGVEDMKHQLLPRTTGLKFCLKELRPSTNWLYDCTIAYEGVPQGMYGQDIFTLKSSLFEGRPPKSVNLHWRRFKICDIPYGNDEQFNRWLMNRWREKDYILEYYYKFGHFPGDDPAKSLLAAQRKRKLAHARTISTCVKGGGWDEFLSIFGPLTSAAGAISSVDMTEPIDFEDLLSKAWQSQQHNLLQSGKMPLGAALQDTFMKILFVANETKPLPKSMMNTSVQLAPETRSRLAKSSNCARNARFAQKADTAPAPNKPLSDDNDHRQRLVKNAKQPVATPSKAEAMSKVSPGLATAVRRGLPPAKTNSVVTRSLGTMKVTQMAAQKVQMKGTTFSPRVGSLTPSKSYSQVVREVSNTESVRPPSVIGSAAESIKPMKRNDNSTAVPTQARRQHKNSKTTSSHKKFVQS